MLGDKDEWDDKAQSTVFVHIMVALRLITILVPSSPHSIIGPRGGYQSLAHIETSKYELKLLRERLFLDSSAISPREVVDESTMTRRASAMMCAIFPNTATK
jgi:hypothetical protein